MCTEMHGDKGKQKIRTAQAIRNIFSLELIRPYIIMYETVFFQKHIRDINQKGR